jgi:hypothetical protein
MLHSMKPKKKHARTVHTISFLQMTTETDAVVWTPAYQAPGRWQGKVTAWSDWWALGKCVQAISVRVCALYAQSVVVSTVAGRECICVMCVFYRSCWRQVQVPRVHSFVYSVNLCAWSRDQPSTM